MTRPDEVTELEMRSERSEQVLLASVFRSPDALAGVLASLPGSDFYGMGRGVVWDACRALSADSQVIEPVTVGRHLLARGQWSNNGQAGGVQHVMQVEIVNTDAESVDSARRHAALVAELARRRELIQAVNRARRLAVEHPGDASEALAAVRAHLNGIGDGDDQRGGTLTWAQMLDEFEFAHTAAAPRRIKTPWSNLNELIGGLYGGRLYVIGGAPGDGKSSAALNIAFKAALDNHQVLVFSAEMPTLDVFARLVSLPAEVPLHTINRYRLGAHQLDRVRDYAKAHDLPLRVNAENVSIGALTTIARAQKHRRGLDVLVVDYLQLIGSDERGRTTEEEIAKVSTALKRLSRELDCAVVVPAQLNRAHTARANPRPTKADLRGSGRIEQDADVVILLFHEEINGKRTDEVTLILDKNRHGPRGEIRLSWQGEYGAMT